MAAGYRTIEIQMGAGILIADSAQMDSTTRRIRINADASGSWGAGGRQATVGEVIAHELAHAVVPEGFSEPGVYNFSESGKEGMWVRRQAGQVAQDLGLPGPNNSDVLITKIPINETQGCTVQKPRGDGPRDGVLFLDGSRGFNGLGVIMPLGTGSQDPAGSRRLASDWTTFAAANPPNNPNQPLPPRQTGDGGLLRYYSGSDSSGTNAPATSEPWQSQASAPPYSKEYLQYQNRLNGNNSTTPVFDPTKPPPMLSPSDYYAAYNNGSIAKFIASLAGVDPDEPTDFSPPPIFSPFYRR